ncbi:MAG: archease [Thermodesulfobacteriota bacterium]
MAPSCYETFEHGADIGIRGFGVSIEESFVCIAKAMFGLMLEDVCTESRSEKIYIQASGFEPESLLVAWLNELLTQADLHSIIFREFDVNIQDLILSGYAWGEYFIPSEGQGIEVKGATLTQARVKKRQVAAWLNVYIVDV